MGELSEKVAAVEDHHHNGNDPENRTASIEETRHSISSVEDFSAPAQRPAESSPDPAMAKAVENVLLSDASENLGRLFWLH
jgi:hypothetical protein